jgi:hypothetical protein
MASSPSMSRAGSSGAMNAASATAEKAREVGRNYLKWNDMVYLVRGIRLQCR